MQNKITNNMEKKTIPYKLFRGELYALDIVIAYSH